MNIRKLTLSMVGLGFFAVVVFAQLGNSADNVEVHVDQAQNKQLETSVLASGKLKFDREVALTAEVIGRVSNIFVKEGDRVRLGQDLIELDPTQYIAEVEQFEAILKQKKLEIERLKLTVNNEKRRFGRLQKLFEKRLVDEEEFAQKRYELSVAELELLQGKEASLQAAAQLKQSQERLAQTSIKAPIAGTVTSIDIKVGETAVASTQAFAGSNIMTIADVDSMVLEVSVDESDIGKLSLGQVADVYTAAYPEDVIKGQVRYISISPEQNQAVAISNKTSKTYSVLVDLAEHDNLELRPGMSCRTEVYQTERAASIVVPIEAVVETNNSSSTTTTGNPLGYSSGYAVWVEVQGHVEQRNVTLGNANDQYQEILQGLLPGENIVVGPASAIRHLFDTAQVEILARGL